MVDVIYQYARRFSPTPSHQTTYLRSKKPIILGEDRLAISKMFNISRTTWTNYELSITEPPPQVLLQMEKMTGITMRRLLEEELIRSTVRSEPINYEEMADSPPQYVDTAQEKVDVSDLENLPVLERVRRIEKVLLGR